MDIKVTPSLLNGSINAVSSKSMAQRLFIASALADTPTKVYLKNSSEDIRATELCLKTLGARFSDFDGGKLITPINREEPLGEKTLKAGESGATLRFLIPVATAINERNTFEAEPSLKKRPIKELLYSLRGVGFTSEKLPLTISGKLRSGDYRIQGNISSQYISGLLFALPLLDGDSKIIIEGEIVSKPYINMTISVLNMFSVFIEKTDYGFFVKGNQKYISPKEAVVEGDYSNSAFFIAVNSLGGDVTVKNLNPDSTQGDKKIYSLLDKISSENAPEISVKSVPDLFPILAFASTFTTKTVKFIDTKRLMLKESNRLSTVCDNINKMGGNAQVLDDSVIVKGTGGLKGGVMVDSFGDHRIAMAITISASFSLEGVTLLSAEAVNKSYPEFFNDFVKLGGKINVL